MAERADIDAADGDSDDLQQSSVKDLRTLACEVRGVPTVMVFKGGQIVDQVVGLVDKDALKRVIDKHI